MLHCRPDLPHLVSNELLVVFRPYMIGTNAVRLDSVCRSNATGLTLHAVRMLWRQSAKLNGCRVA